MSPRVMYIGDRSCVEFRDPADWLQSRTESLFLPAVSPPAILEFDPLAIVIAQAHPGVFRAADIELIHRTVPLAPLFALLGPWCEGEIRTGRPWAGVQRVYWHQWRPRFERFFFPEPAAGVPRRLPKSAADTEQLFADSRRPKVQAMEVVVDCSPARLPSLVEAMSAVGFRARIAFAEPRESSRAHNSGLPSPVFLLDVAQFGEQGLRQLRCGDDRWRPRAIVVSTDFVRFHEAERWRESGASIVLARPWLLEDLRWCLEHAEELATSPATRRDAA